MSSTASLLSVAVEGTSPPSMKVRGEADFHNRGQIYDAVRSLIDEGHETVHADLSELSYMDSSALATLVKCAVEVREAGGVMELTGASRHVARVLTQCGAALFFKSALPNVPLAGNSDELASWGGFWRVCDFTLLASPDAASFARQRIVDLVSALPLSISESADVMIAFGEAVTNAIRHGCRCDPDQRITVKCVAGPGRLAIDVTDPGPGFSPDEVPVPTSQSILDGGMGIYIMRELMDEVDFLFEGGTTARLVRRLPADDSARSIVGKHTAY